MEQHVYVGIKGTIAAIDRRTGEEAWRTELKGYGFVVICVEEDTIVAYSGGHLFGIDPVNGDILWENELKGLGYGLATVTGRFSPNGAQIEQALQANQAQQANMGSGSVV